MIPDKLYRGDADKFGIRKLKATLSNRLLFTNLISGGNGKIIFRNPLIELVKIHINPGYDKTHFLSFSELEERALEFGSYGFNGDKYPFMEDTNNWDFALFVFDTAKLINCDLIETGVYKCLYDSSFNEFKNGFEILLIDTVEYLKAHVDLNTDSQIKNAERDKEWLILPINSILLNGSLEYSAKIDISNIIDYELYKMI